MEEMTLSQMEADVDEEEMFFILQAQIKKLKEDFFQLAAASVEAPTLW